MGSAIDPSFHPDASVRSNRKGTIRGLKGDGNPVRKEERGWFERGWEPGLKSGNVVVSKGEGGLKGDWNLVRKEERGWFERKREH